MVTSTKFALDWAEARINRLTAAAIALALLPVTMLAQWLKSVGGLLAEAPLPYGYDFLAFWTSARLFLSGGAAALGDPAQLAAYQFAQGDPIFQPWLYPPTYLAFMQSLGALPLPVALTIFSLVGLLFWTFAALKYRPEANALGLAIALGAPVVVINLVQGQNGLIFGALFMLALSARTEGRHWLAALMIAPLLGKPHLFVLIPVALIAARDWSFFFKCTLTCGGFLAITLVEPGLGAWRVFLSGGDLMAFTAQQPINWVQQITPYAFFSLLGAKASFAMAAQGIVALGAAAFVFRIWRNPHIATPLKHCALLSATLLVSPYAYRYDMIPLLGSALILMHFGLRHGFLRREKLALAALVIGPAFIPSIALATGIQIGFPLLLLALWSCQRRIAQALPHNAVVGSIP